MGSERRVDTRLTAGSGTSSPVQPATSQPGDRTSESLTRGGPEVGSPLVSVIINNYNYARFLREAIDSALGQTYPYTEVIVVDDGSTDGSREIIGEYGDRVIPVLKENGGQPSAVNAGVARSRGEIICFLDADDVFNRDKVAVVVSYLQEGDRLKQPLLVYHHVELTDETGRPVGITIPRRHREYPPNMYRYAARYGYLPQPAPQTSAIAITRALAELVYPLPEGVKYSADDTTVKAALLLAEVHKLPPSLSKWREHGRNNYLGNEKPKTEEFLKIQERFLNSKLRENGRMPVIAFFRSIYARDWYIYHGCYKQLLRLALQVPSHHLNWITARFALKTVVLAGFLALRSTRRDGARHTALRNR